MPSISIELFYYLVLGVSALWFLYILFVIVLYRLFPRASGEMKNISIQMLKKRDDESNFNPAASSNDSYKNVSIKYFFEHNRKIVEGTFRATIKSDRALNYKGGDRVCLHYLPYFPQLSVAAVGISFINRREMVLAFFVNLFILTISTLFLWLFSL
jgi:hypothetical protein